MSPPFGGYGDNIEQTYVHMQCTFVAHRCLAQLGEGETLMRKVVIVLAAAATVFAASTISASARPMGIGGHSIGGRGISMGSVGGRGIVGPGMVRAGMVRPGIGMVRPGIGMVRPGIGMVRPGLATVGRPWIHNRPFLRRSVFVGGVGLGWWGWGGYSCLRR